MKVDFTKAELNILRRLTTSRKIQDFLDTIPMNFEVKGETCLSPRSVLRENKAHCMEGAMLAAAALRVNGHRPIVIDLKSSMKDVDHVVAVFQIGKHWGAISKTNHAVLRYREPIYNSIRELAMSYFHEYFLDNGEKTMRSYSHPVDLSRFDARGWMTADEDVWYVPEYVDAVRHYDILTRSQMRRLRKADEIERRVGRVVEWDASGVEST